MAPQAPNPLDSADVAVTLALHRIEAVPVSGLWEWLLKSLEDIGDGFALDCLQTAMPKEPSTKLEMRLGLAELATMMSNRPANYVLDLTRLDFLIQVERECRHPLLLQQHHLNKVQSRFLALSSPPSRSAFTFQGRNGARLVSVSETSGI